MRGVDSLRCGRRPPAGNLRSADGVDPLWFAGPGFTTDLESAFETPQREVRSLAYDAVAHGLPLPVDGALVRPFSRSRARSGSQRTKAFVTKQRGAAGSGTWTLAPER